MTDPVGGYAVPDLDNYIDSGEGLGEPGVLNDFDDFLIGGNSDEDSPMAIHSKGEDSNKGCPS